MNDQKYKWMDYAIDLALKGWGKTNPNPLVGCVIVKNNKILAEGYHAALGHDHAERAAINDAKKRGVNLEGSTLYVNLEPCVHQGRTPPCADLIIESGIKSVAIAMKDPNPLVTGKGVEKLQKAGIKVEIGIREKEAKKLNEIFIKYITTGLPFILMKTAMSIDGKIAANSGDSKWISGTDSRKIVHHWRNRIAAIMVGQNTVLLDNPSLTTRMADEDTKNPVRIILDSSNCLNPDSKVFDCDNQTKVILASTSRFCPQKAATLVKKGVEVVCVENEMKQIDLCSLISYLGEIGIDSIMLEGGGKLNEAFLRLGLIDKIMLFMAPKIIGGCNAVSCFNGCGIEKMSQAIEVSDLTVTGCGEDLLIEGYPVYT